MSKEALTTAPPDWQKARTAEYLHSLEPEREPFLQSLRDEAAAGGVPILRQETEHLLTTLLRLHRPRRILEIGTAIGYSAILMARCLERDAGAETSPKEDLLKRGAPADGLLQIDTIENYPPRILAAKENFAAAGLTDRIRLLEGDAGELLKEGSELDGSVYDFVFLDAAKGQYLLWLPDILRHMRPGAVLVADNVLQDETVMESRFAIPRRERTTHARMREFLYTLMHDPRLESCVLPVGDGVSISVVL